MLFSSNFGEVLHIEGVGEVGLGLGEVVFRVEDGGLSRYYVFDVIFLLCFLRALTLRVAIRLNQQDLN